MTFFDGHMHSTASDGKLEPAALVEAVAAAGVRVMALTDHDTFAGHAEAAERAARAGIELVPGVEMSVELGGREIHVLAYFVGEGAGELAAALERARQVRREHLPAMLARLAELGYPLEEAEVLAELRGARVDQAVGRPHVARALVKRGYFRTVDEVFDRLLANDQPGYVRRILPQAGAMIAAARAAGGVCAIAHPAVSDIKPSDLDELRDTGLAGAEVYHPSHENEDVIFYLRECARLGLVATGGSDHHGETYPTDGPGLDRAGWERLAAKRS